MLTVSWMPCGFHSGGGCLIYFPSGTMSSNFSSVYLCLLTFLQLTDHPAIPRPVSQAQGLFSQGKRKSGISLPPEDLLRPRGTAARVHL